MRNSKLLDYTGVYKLHCAYRSLSIDPTLSLCYIITMKIHPLLQDPNAVLLVRVPLDGTVSWQDYRRAGAQAMRALRVELEGEKVVFKPNVTSGERFADPDTGITTHPGFLQGMIEYLRERGTPARRMTIVEDPRDSDDNHPRHWRGTGFDRLSQETGVRLHCPTTYTCVKKTVPQPQVFERLNVSRLAVAPNTVLFNVPKLKTHNLGITTLGMKNLMGLVNVFDRHYCLQAWDELPEEIQHDQRPRHEWFDREKHELWQTGLARRLVDTAQVLHPAMNIVEGVVGREGTGFQRGRNRALGWRSRASTWWQSTARPVTSWASTRKKSSISKLAAQAGLGCAEISQLKLYTEEQGELVPVLRSRRAAGFAPVSRHHQHVGEDRDPFQSAEAVVDPSDSFFGKSKA
jgi:uncharacterized protein (DUF362 family)